MKEIVFEDRQYDVFKMFSEDWALATAGDSLNDYNTLTIGWGSMGTLWGGRSIITVYVSPARYTYEYLEKSDTFTVSFFGESYKKALAYLGSHSGRDEDKVAASGLTPVLSEPGITFKEAKLTFVCKKIYADAFDGDRAPEDIKERLYTKIPAHHFYIGEIIKVLEA